MNILIFLCTVLFILILYYWFKYKAPDHFGDLKKVKSTDESDDSLKTFLDNCKNHNNLLIVFDLETNGLNCMAHSVLSFSAIKFSIIDGSSLREEGRFNRYYFPTEAFNRAATNINGLTRKKITELRRPEDYAKFFLDDKDDIKEFCQGVFSYMAHNFQFDSGFINFLPMLNAFCTMKSNTNLVKAKWLPNKGEWKYPTLSETAWYYKISASSRSFHNSMYDVEVTAGIFQEMIKRFGVKNSPNFEVK